MGRAQKKTGRLLTHNFMRVGLVLCGEIDFCLSTVSDFWFGWIEKLFKPGQ